MFEFGDTFIETKKPTYAVANGSTFFAVDNRIKKITETFTDPNFTLTVTYLDTTTEAITGLSETEFDTLIATIKSRSSNPIFLLGDTYIAVSSLIRSVSFDDANNVKVIWIDGSEETGSFADAGAQEASFNEITNALYSFGTYKRIGNSVVQVSPRITKITYDSESSTEDGYFITLHFGASFLKITLTNRDEVNNEFEGLLSDLSSL